MPWRILVEKIEPKFIFLKSNTDSTNILFSESLSYEKVNETAQVRNAEAQTQTFARYSLSRTCKLMYVYIAHS